MFEREKYLNWFYLIETDYITMFIKTWFTFLASLQELIDNSDKQKRGDSKILNEYKNNLFKKLKIEIDEEFIKNIYRAYWWAKNKCLNSDIFLESYFKIFYSYDEKYSRNFLSTNRSKKTELFLKVYKEIKKNNKEIYLKILLNDEREEFKKYFGEKIDTNLFLSGKIENRVFENKNKFIEKVLLAILQKAESIINSENGIKEKEKQKRVDFLKNKSLKDIKEEFYDQFDIESIFPLKPHNVIKSLNKNTWEIENENKPEGFDEELTIWFIDFAYKLRNILFHYIINPGDDNWRILFKHTYLALKHITKENIKLLQNKGEKNDN